MVTMMITPVVVLFTLSTQAAKPNDPQPPAKQSPVTATAKDKVQEGRKALAARVAKAHRGDNKEVIDRYTTTITIKPLGKKAENVDVELEVQYGAKIIRAKDADPVEMIRYKVGKGDKPLERGKDPRPWQRIGNRVTGLLGRDDPESRALLDSHTRLCRQMLQFLDAGAILRSLRGDDPVTTTTLNLGRKFGKVETEFISGRLASFPVFRGEDKSVKMRAVFMEAWVDKKTSRLAAVKIFPIATNGKTRRDDGEFIVLRNYGKSKGVLVPQVLLIFEENGKTLRERAMVKLLTFKLNAKLTKANFARPD